MLQSRQGRQRQILAPERVNPSALVRSLFEEPATLRLITAADTASGRSSGWNASVSKQAVSATPPFATPLCPPGVFRQVRAETSAVPDKRQSAILTTVEGVPAMTSSSSRAISSESTPEASLAAAVRLQKRSFDESVLFTESLLLVPGSAASQVAFCNYYSRFAN